MTKTKEEQADEYVDMFDARTYTELPYKLRLYFALKHVNGLIKLFDEIEHRVFEQTHVQIGCYERECLTDVKIILESRIKNG